MEWQLAWRHSFLANKRLGGTGWCGCRRRADGDGFHGVRGLVFRLQESYYLLVLLLYLTNLIMRVVNSTTILHELAAMSLYLGFDISCISTDWAFHFLLMRKEIICVLSHLFFDLFWLRIKLSLQKFRKLTSLRGCNWGRYEGLFLAAEAGVLAEII